MRIPQEIVDRVRESTDIVALIGEQVRLTKAGRSWKGLCPFHTEKTPSFHVNPDRQIYHCFGCGAGGNAITFLIEHSKLTFPEAVRHLADRAGITIPRNYDDGAAETETTRLYEALAVAAEFYRERLEHPYAGQAARTYLEQRRIDPELAELFGLGYAPPGWQNFFDHAGRRFTLDILAKAGLVVRKDDGGGYDRFRNRLMVPIRNATGRVIAFGGRTMGGDEAKYINSPESPVYQKGQVLFGLFQAKDDLRRGEEAILVEGYLDLLRVFGAGFRNVVAVSGTAFTPQQAALLRRYVTRVRLVFDGDDAGLNAAWKAAGLCLAADLEPRLAILPGQHDPDSLIRDEGPDAFRRALETADRLADFAVARLLPRLGREDTLRRLVEQIRECPEPIRRRLLCQEAAERLNFDEAALVRAVEERRPAGGPPVAAPAPVAPAELPAAEKTMLAIALAEPGLAARLAGEIDEADLEHEASRRILRWLNDSGGSADSGHRLMESVAGTPLARIVSELLGEPTHGGLEAALDCARRLRMRHINQNMAELRSQLAVAERNHEADRAHALLEQIGELTQQKKTLQKRTLTTGA